MKLAVSILMLGGMLSLAGCAVAPTATDSPTATTGTAVPSASASGDPVAYAGIDELRAAFVSATGLPCPPFSQYYTDPNGVICTEGGWQLFWTSSVADRNNALQLSAGSAEPSPFVVGPNWLINGGSDLQAYQTVAEAMHGHVWDSGQPIPAD